MTLPAPRPKSGSIDLNYDRFRSIYCAGVSHAPKVDYLRLGASYDPEITELIKRVIYDKAGFRVGRYELRKNTLRFDGKVVGGVLLSKGVSNRYGRKILFNFSGEWFRTGLTCEDAWAFTNLFEDWAANLFTEIRRQDWVTFRSIERLDIAVEIYKSRLGQNADLVRDLAEEHKFLPGAWKFRNYNGSEDGLTHYIGQYKDPLKKRNDRSMMRIYGYHPTEATLEQERPSIETALEHDEKTLRFEYEAPKLRMADGTDIVDDALREAAKLFNALLPYAFIAEPDLDGCQWKRAEELVPGECTDHMVVIPRGTMVIQRPDFGESVRPEMHSRIPFAGHPAHEQKRQRSQGTTVLCRQLNREIRCELLARRNWIEITRATLREELHEARHKFERDPHGLAEAWFEIGRRYELIEELDIYDELTSKWVELQRRFSVPAPTETHTLESAWGFFLFELMERAIEAVNVGYRGPARDVLEDGPELADQLECVWGDDQPEEIKTPPAHAPAARHFAVEDLAACKPLEVDECVEIIETILGYMWFMHPEAQPYFETTRAATFKRAAMDEDDWIERMLRPVAYTERHTSSWVLHQTAGTSFYRNEETGDVKYVGSHDQHEIERSYGYSWSPATAHKIRLKRAEERASDDKMQAAEDLKGRWTVGEVTPETVRQNVIFARMKLRQESEREKREFQKARERREIEATLREKYPDED